MAAGDALEAPQQRLARDRTGVRELDRATRALVNRGHANDVFVGVLPRVRPSGTASDVERAWVLCADCDTPESIERLASFGPAAVDRVWLGVPTTTSAGAGAGSSRGPQRGSAARRPGRARTRDPRAPRMGSGARTGLDQVGIEGDWQGRPRRHHRRNFAGHLSCWQCRAGDTLSIGHVGAGTPDGGGVAGDGAWPSAAAPRGRVPRRHVGRADAGRLGRLLTARAAGETANAKGSRCRPRTSSACVSSASSSCSRAREQAVCGARRASRDQQGARRPDRSGREDRRRGRRPIPGLATPCR